MKQKVLVKYSLISAVLVAVALCLLGKPCDRVNAGPPEPTLTPALDIRTRLQPYQTPRVKPSQSDGRLFEEAPLPSEVEEPPVGALDQRTFYAIADATVLQGYPTVNLGHTTDMWAGYDEYLEPDGKIARSLVRFNMTSLPPNVKITKAMLRVYLVSCWDYPGTSRRIRTYRITSTWSENNVTWNNKPGYESAYGSRSIVCPAWGWYEFDVTDLVRAWYDGTYTNHGIMLRGPEVSGLNASWRGFSTREGPYRPQLVIKYATSTPPTITGLPDQALKANTSLDNAIDLWAYASDAESPDIDLTFNIDNTPAPNAGVTIDGNRHTDINPAPDWAGQTDAAIHVTDPGGLSEADTCSVDVSQEPPITTTIYLPIILKSTDLPPAPAAPVLDPIDNSDGDGNYTVSWSSVSGATGYVLQEADNASFPSPITVYSGASTSRMITGRDVGTYYYRVQATNSSGSSPWSNVISVQVAPPAPAAPVLDPIDNSDGDGNYTVSWSSVSGATSYTLEEDDNDTFSSPGTMYSGPAISTSIYARDVGTYYYRVKASNDLGSSDWSNIQSVVVTVPLTGPEPGHYTGTTPSVSFDVTEGQQVCNFDITVPFGAGSCRIRPSSCAEIADNDFTFSRSELGAIYVITGTFDTPTHAFGSYRVSMCGDTIVFPASEGTWEASK
jgi:hypothetical protein